MLGPEDLVTGLSADGKNLLVAMPGIPAKIARVDLATGRRELWKEISPADPAGVQSFAGLKFSADGKSYAYSVLRIISDLYVVDGLK
jgi:hypothetical protein